MNEEKIKFTIGQIIKHNSLEDSVEKIFTLISQMKVEDGYDMDYVRQAFEGGRKSFEENLNQLKNIEAQLCNYHEYFVDWWEEVDTLQSKEKLFFRVNDITVLEIEKPSEEFETIVIKIPKKVVTNEHTIIC